MRRVALPFKLYLTTIPCYVHKRKCGQSSRFCCHCKSSERYLERPQLFSVRVEPHRSKAPFSSVCADPRAFRVPNQDHRPVFENHRASEVVSRVGSALHRKNGRAFGPKQSRGGREYNKASQLNLRSKPKTDIRRSILLPHTLLLLLQ